MANPSVEEIVKRELAESHDLDTKATKGKIFVVDTWGNITYSWIAGTALDIYTGLTLQEIVISRSTMTGINAVVGGPYGWWREKVFEKTGTTEKSGRIRRYVTDLAAFIPPRALIYAVTVTIASLLSEEPFDPDKVRDGAIKFTVFSPLIGPTMGMYIDLFRRVFGVKSAAEGAYKKNE
jgi:hypothetical protein